jgi:Tol biopolymer transport system component
MIGVRVTSGLLALAVIALCTPGHSQLYRFGKNKVQFDRFEWQKMETEHFDLYFYPEESELASFAAPMAEAGFRHAESKFGYTVQRRIPLIIYSSHVYFEQTNIIPGYLPEGVAGFTEFLKGRVALPMSGSLPEFERVLYHELIHVFMFDLVRHVLRSRGITEYRPGPLWFSEGLAEYWSSEWDSRASMIVRDALFSRRLVPISLMYQINGTFQMYKEGQSICEYMAREYGEDVFERILHNWWKAETFAEVFEMTTGETLALLDESWQYDLEKRILPVIEDADPPSQMATALTHSGFNLKPSVARHASAATEADSQHVLYFSNTQGYTQIVRQAVGGGEVDVVVEGERSAAFESLHAFFSGLAVSADGDVLAFAAKRNGRDHLVTWDLRLGEESGRFTFPTIVAISSPSWSPDNQMLVFSGAERGGITDLYTVDVRTGELNALTGDLYHDSDPTWHPEGDRIAFSSDRWQGGRQGLYNLFQYELTSGRITQLTRGNHNDVQPQWAPDGQSMVFSSDRDGIYNLHLLGLEGDPVGSRAHVRRISSTLTGSFDPSWLPDQSGVLFTGFEAGRFNIYRMALDSTQTGRAATDTMAMVSYHLDDLPMEGDQWQLEGDEIDSSSLTRRSYKRKLSLDVAQSQISQDPLFGTSGGIQIGLSDVLGNDQYYFVLSHISGGNSNLFNGLNLAFARVYLAQQLNIGWGVFRLNDRFTGRFGRQVRERRTGAYLELSYPFTRNDRLETRMTMRHSDINRQLEGRQLKGWLMSNHISYTHDSSLWIPTGPLEGTRYSVGVGQDIDFKSSRRYNTTVFGDYRHYFRLSRRTSLAQRYMARHSRGDVPEFFSMGGSWTLRGYPWRSIWGRNLVLVNHELRFPLLDRMILAFPFGNIDFSAFRGALFVDAGNAWNDEFGDWLGSFGGGTRLGLGGFFVFRLDASRRTDFRSVDNNTQWDFFFGWDF